ncbi:hypothetical protein VKT23_020612 [Stygiomarasmius scandens]|uniref:Uncharacterized protein n=1 Tax=Marasmiellus scandens TaxID=2682957 RepID=A0ABR1ILD6_9AGAR
MGKPDALSCRTDHGTGAVPASPRLRGAATPGDIGTLTEEMQSLGTSDYRGYYGWPSSKDEEEDSYTLPLVMKEADHNALNVLQASYIFLRETSASDWDNFKIEGWTARDLLPLMKRLENYQKPVNNDTHRYDGPIAISNGGSVSALAHDFLHAADTIGIPFSNDTQDLDTAHASEIWAKYINRHTGRLSVLQQFPNEGLWILLGLKDYRT